MPEEHAQKTVALSPLVAGMLTAPAVGAAMGLALATAAEWNVADAKWTSLQTVLAAAACWLIAALVGLLLTSLISAHSPRRMPMAILVASAVRAGMAVFDGVIVFTAFKPESKTFWCAFLFAGLLCLAYETAWSMLTLRRTTAAHTVVGVS
ncbi:MAG: hypothetical protein JSR77_02720 [Planctomycetes bacterium]|nr:hypothetical protein [Planctomycetota bacterium]